VKETWDTLSLIRATVERLHDHTSVPKPGLLKTRNCQRREDSRTVQHAEQIRSSPAGKLPQEGKPALRWQGTTNTTSPCSQAQNQGTTASLQSPAHSWSCSSHPASVLGTADISVDYRQGSHFLEITTVTNIYTLPVHRKQG